MTSQLQNLIQSAQKLSPLEQVELLQAISQFLLQHHQKDFSTDFWQPHSLESLANAQAVLPVHNVSALRVDFWPEEESVDEFIDTIYRQRAEDRRADL